MSFTDTDTVTGTDEALLTGDGPFPVDPGEWLISGTRSDSDTAAVTDLASVYKGEPVTVCGPIRIIPKPTLYTVASCGADGFAHPMEALRVVSNFRDEQQDVAAVLADFDQESFLPMVVQILDPFGDPVQLNHRYAPWVGHGTVDPDTPPKILFDMFGPSGHHQLKDPAIVSKTRGTIRLNFDTYQEPLLPGVYQARFTLIWLDKVIAAPTRGFAVHVEETFAR